MFIVIMVHLVNGQRVKRLRPSRLIIAVVVSRITTVPVRSGSRPVTATFITVTLLLVVRVVVSFATFGGQGLEGVLCNAPDILFSGKGVGRKRVRHRQFGIGSLVRVVEGGNTSDLSRMSCMVIRAGKGMDMLLGTSRHPMAIGSLGLSTGPIRLDCVVVSGNGMGAKGLGTVKFSRG